MSLPKSSMKPGVSSVRVTQQLWRDYGASADRDRYAYGYDRNSSRTWKENVVVSEKDELYAYDNLNRLTSSQRGTLNANKDEITGTPAREQDWTLDPVGNWSAIVSKISGANDSPYDTRTHTLANEIATITPQGAGAFNVKHDARGNMTELPDRTDPSNKADRYSYDAWNRLAKVERTTNYGGEPPTWSVVVVYEHDGFNRRLKKDLPGEGIDVRFFYTGWRCIEERELDGQDWEARRQYVFGSGYLDQAALMDQDTDGDGDCTDIGGSTRYYYCRDANYNVTALLDVNGDAVERMHYDPYG